MPETRNRILLQTLNEEHKEISSQIADLRRFWSEVNELGEGPKYEEMGTRIQVLRSTLAKHFDNEEREGYLSPALERAPRFATKAEQLEKQHTQFLVTLDQYIAKLQACEPAYHCWQEVFNDFEDFLEQLHEHESAESAIVQTAIRDGGGPTD